MTRKYKRSTKGKARRNRIIFVTGIFLFLIALIIITQPFSKTIGILLAYLIGFAIILFSINLTLKYIKKRKLTSGIHSHLINALEAMDSTGHYYNDEREANRELISILKSHKLPLQYEQRLPDGRTADGKINDIIIEGKLSPRVDEVDRLLGQLQNYCSHGFKVNIVIYGYLQNEQRKRIENEILDRYPKRAFLTYLPNPKRDRVI